MNKTHRLIWSDTRQAWTVAHEAASSRGKPASRAKRLTALLSMLALHPGAFAQAPPPHTLPTGGQVVAGQASLSQAGSTMNIRQSTDKLILNWGSFSIGSQASVNFQQPGSHAIALNRVMGADPSAIYGRLSANGQVFLVNPNGIVFGQGGRVDVGGLVASTLAINNEDFLAGKHRYTRMGTTAGVSNQGDIYGRYIALLAPEVKNEGLIVARQGTVVMAAGEAATLNLTGNQLIDVQVDKASINTLVENRHLVQADDGKVILTAQSANGLMSQVVNTGAIEAAGLSSDGGTVRLLAGSTLVHSGSIKVDAAAHGQGGTALLIADLANPASRTTVSGSITARGGSASGDGGFVETSASHLKVEGTTAIDTRAALGKTGSWLLDPVDFTIAASGGDIDSSTLAAALFSSDVTISTLAPLCTGVAGCGAGSGGNGDIFVNDTISWGAHALTLSADRHIVINAPLNVTGTGGLHLKFDQADGFVGNYFVNAPVNLAATSTFTTQAGTFLPASSYTVLVDQAGLMAMTLNDPAARYVLGNNLTASAPWTPIGTNGANAFMGVFDGLGHVVRDLTVAGTADYRGMFGYTGVPAIVQNIGLINASVSGTRYVGALVGRNEGAVYRAHASGSVTASTAVATPITAVGGLVGQNDGVIDGSRSSVNVTASSDSGGNVYAGGGLDGGTGGLAGISTSSVSNSLATGSVVGLRDVGGLVGWANFNVAASYATGAVSLAGNGTDRINVGGLVGHGASWLGAGTSFWNTQTTGQSASFNGAGFVTAGGMDTANMQTAANFTSATAANGNVNPNWDPTFWALANGSYPGLRFSNAGLFTAVTLTMAAASKTYGDANGALPSLTLSGCADCISIAAWGSAMTSTTDAGDYAYSLANLLVLNFASGTSASDYAITWADPSVYKFSVIPRTVTLNASKTYDGAAALSGAQLSIGNLVHGQTLNHAGAIASDAHVATANKYVSGIILADGTGLASNYQLPSLAGASAGLNTVTINARTLTVTPSSTTLSKVYDGSTAVPAGFAPSYTLGGLVAGDTDATLVHTGAAYDSKNVATASKITLSGLAISGVTGSQGSLPTDYVLDATSKDLLGASITKKDVTVGFTVPPAVSKVYDGTTAASVDMSSLQISGVLPSEGLLIPAGTLNVGAATVPGTYSDKNANGALTVTVPLLDWQPLLSSTADPANYKLPASLTVAGEITKRPITGQLVGTVSKTYDGTASATLALNNLQFDTSGFVAGELAYVDGNSRQNGTYVDEAGQANPQAGTGKKVVVNIDPNAYTAWNCAAVPFAGCAATNVNNYSFPTTLSGFVGTINKAPLTVKAGDVAKTYDGAAFAGGGALDIIGLQNGESPFVLGGAFAFAGNSQGARNAGSYTITPQGLTSNNYDITFTSGALTISPKALVALDGGLTGSVSKVYDGNSLAPGLKPLNFNIGGWASGEGATVTKTTGTFTDGPNASASSTRPVTVTLESGDFSPTGGTNLANYTLPTDFSGNIGEITKRPITATLVGTISKTYDGTDTAAVAPGNYNFSIGNYVAGEGAYLAGTGSWLSGTFASKNAGSGQLVTVNINPADYTPVGSTQLDNYSFPTVVSGHVGTINKVTLTYTADPQKWVLQELTPPFTGTVTGFINGENQASATTGTVSWTTPATTASPLGSHAINGGGLTAGNYEFVQAADNATALTLTTATQGTAQKLADVISQAVNVFKFWGKSEKDLTDTEKGDLSKATAAYMQVTDMTRGMSQEESQTIWNMGAAKAASDEANRLKNAAQDEATQAAATLAKNKSALDAAQKALDQAGSDDDKNAATLALKKAQRDFDGSQWDLDLKKAGLSTKTAEADLAAKMAQNSQDAAAKSLADAALRSAQKPFDDLKKAEQQALDTTKAAQDAQTQLDAAKQTNEKSETDANKAKEALDQATADAKTAKDKVGVTQFFATLSAGQAALNQKAADDAAKLADPNGEYIRNFAQRAATRAKLESIQRLVNTVASLRAQQGGTETSPGATKRLLDKLNSALKGDASEDLTALNDALSQVQAEAQQALAPQSDYDKFHAQGGRDFSDLTSYLDASWRLMVALKDENLQKVGSEAAANAAQSSRAMAERLAKEAADAAAKAGASSKLAQDLAAQAAAAKVTADADIAAAQKAEKDAKDALDQANAKRKADKDAYEAAQRAKQEAWEKEQRAKDEAIAAKKVATEAARATLNKAQEEADRLANPPLTAAQQKQNVLTNAKNELALWTKGVENERARVQQAQDDLAQAQKNLQQSKANKTKYEAEVKDKTAALPGLQAAAKADMATHGGLMSTWNTEKAALDKLQTEFDALNNAQYSAAMAKAAADSAVARAEKRLESLGFKMEGSDLFSIGLSLIGSAINAGKVDDAKKALADAQAAAELADAKYTNLNGQAKAKAAEADKAQDALNASLPAIKAAADKANASALLAAQTEADIGTAKKNVDIMASNVKNADQYIQEQSAALPALQKQLKVNEAELPVKQERVEKAQADLDSQAS